jgi:hypothetical protein
MGRSLLLMSLGDGQAQGNRREGQVMPEAGRFTNTRGDSVSVDTDESYIVWTHGDTRMVVDKTSGGYHTVDFASKAERDRAVRAIAADHGVYDRDDPDTQINPAAPNYKRRR